jgi:hypothetical protein
VAIKQAILEEGILMNVVVGLGIVFEHAHALICTLHAAQSSSFGHTEPSSRIYDLCKLLYCTVILCSL